MVAPVWIFQPLLIILTIPFFHNNYAFISAKKKLFLFFFVIISHKLNVQCYEEKRLFFVQNESNDQENMFVISKSSHFQWHFINKKNILVSILFLLWSFFRIIHKKEATSCQFYSITCTVFINKRCFYSVWNVIKSHWFRLNENVISWYQWSYK